MNNPPPRRFYVVHDEQGRILGLVPVAPQPVNERVRLGYRVLAGPGQKVTEIELAAEHASLRPHELLEFEVAVDPQTGKSQLRRPAQI